PALEISRSHARIWQRDGSYFIEDLGSSNGTFLNGERVSRAALAERDVIHVGPYTLMLHGEGPPAAACMAADPAPPEDLVVRARVPIDPDAVDFQGPAAGQQLQAVLRVGQRLARTLDLDQLLEKLLAHLAPLFAQAERASVLFRRGDDLAPRAQAD